jgi:cell division septation protein DedD
VTVYLNKAQKGFAWVPGLSARNTRTAFDDARFTAEEIVSVVRAGESGEKLTDLCQSIGITPETYYAWKARYSGLTASQVHDLRRRTRVRKQRVTMLACTLGVTAVGAGALIATRQSDAAVSTPAIAHPLANAAVPSTPPVVPAAAPPAAAAPQPMAAAPQPPVTASVPATTTTSAGPAIDPSKSVAGRPTPMEQRPTSNNDFAVEGYSVQVSATPDLQQARTALEKLTAASHPAHITTKTIDGVEMYRVRVGPFGSRDAAVQMADRLTRDGYGSPWITR